MIDPSKLRPFDEDAALRGEPVCTQDGQPVTQLKKFDTDLGICTLAGVYKGHILLFCPDDLRMAPKVREVWVRVQFSRVSNSYHAAILAGNDAENKLNTSISTINDACLWIGPAVKVGEVEE